MRNRALEICQLDNNLGATSEAREFQGPLPDSQHIPGLPELGKASPVTTVAATHEHYKAVLEQQPELNIVEQDELIAVIARGLAAEEVSEAHSPSDALLADSAAGRQARQRLVMSFGGRVVNIVYWNARRLNAWDPTFLQDGLQTGMLALLSSTVSYARLPPEERHAFWPYAQAAIKRHIWELSLGQIIGKTITRDGVTRHLGRYFAARAVLVNQHGREPSDTELSTALQLPKTDIQVIRSWAIKTVTLQHDRKAERTKVWEDVPDYQPENEAAQILVERALEFLPPRQRAIISLRFGLDESPQLGTGEIAKKLGMNETAVSFAYGRDMGTLREIVKGLQKNSLNYEELRVKKNIRNALSILAFAGIDPPEDAHMPKLRELAKASVDNTVNDKRERQTLYDLYGLNPTGKRLLHAEVAARLGMSKSNVRNVEGRALSQIAQARGQADN